MKITELPLSSNKQINKIQDVAKKFRMLANADAEHLIIQYLDEGAYDLGAELVQIGDSRSGKIPLVQIVRKILLSGASRIIVIHNHPGDTCLPSEPDKQFTDELNLACNTIGVLMHDSIIIAAESFYSFSKKSEIVYED